MIFENQPHQQDCIKNIIQVLRNFDFETHANLDYSLDEFYKTNKALNFGKSGGKNLDILMETGTGKTFVYINAIFEINRVYNQNKFIIFVPRKAILESVKQNLKLTKEYFYNIYKKHLFIYEYKDEKSLNGIISHFIGNEKELSVLLLTSSAINKKDNILNKPKESLFNQGSVLENIASLKPISFIDEPHLLKGDKFKSYFSKINSLYFRFGATFPSGEDKLSNLIYSLDSISAFKSYLVKQISVHTIIDSDFEPILKDIQNQTCKFDYYLDGIKYSTFVEKGDDLGEKLHYKNLSGVTINSIKNKKLYLSNSQTIELTTSYTLSKAQISTLLSKAIDLHFEKEKRLFKQNIKALTLFFIPNVSDFRGDVPFIKNEFSKIYIAKRAEILKDKSLDKDYRAFLEKDFDKNGKLAVMNGYFSGDSKAKGSAEDKEADDIRLILEKKEELLSFKTQLRFIFSVWALQEGWDNPNVFTLVKLASSSSETTKRQQVGRGLRLAVNEYGKRLSFNSNDSEFYSINALDVVINAKESDFIESLQSEIDSASLSFNEKTLNTTVLKSIVKLNEREIARLLIHLEDENFIYFDEESEVYTILKPLNEICKNDEKTKELLKDKFENFITFITPSKNKNDQIINANKSSKTAKIKKNLALEFKELWKSINQTSTIIYKDIDDNILASEVARSFDKCSVERIKVTSKKETFDIKSGKIIKNESEFIKDSELGDAFIAQNLKKFAITNGYPLKFILKIYSKISNHQNFKNNSLKAFKSLDNIIKNAVHQTIISKVEYNFSSTTITKNSPFYHLFDEKENPKEMIETSKLGRYESPAKPQPNYLYDKTIYDSDIEKNAIENDPATLKIKNSKSQIKVFAKLPKFSIPTPFKEYQPDFAYLIENDKGKKIFFICETKGYDSESKIPTNEKFKIDYAKIFFKRLDEFIKTSSPNTQVVFKTRINNQELIDILGEIL